MKKSFVFWVEEYFYNPNLFQKIVSSILSPISFLYCIMMFLRFKIQTEEDFGIKIISVGNLNVGGSGKTPLVTALSLKYENAAIILRGYGRESKGLHIVKDFDNILCDVKTSGDEAMIYAKLVKNAIVIVSEDRKIAIRRAKEMGAEIVFLDDGYSKHSIKKLDLLIEVNSENNFCLPAGPFRERLWKSKECVILRDGIDCKRIVNLKDDTSKMSLVTAIARPARLDEYLPEVVSKNYFEDHHTFIKSEIEDIFKRDDCDSLLVTYKDFVKLESFGFPLSLLDMYLEVTEDVFIAIDDYISLK
ncbi:tetraacyldisaccharide 4'-kinase [Sulfurimonas sp.]|uniref:tetraacyldisaccharide 4'-kinase n=1 Tax=Sulfurimonas sp. TaxID=2022749 RepID=UPI0025DC515A|nr:tetraacyldisaccharide 4'-kinase [Sulfurimonas sp.]MBT5933727.1 tetraacyldisaccharide 4'-kinase [Sulfurimonas sp.]